jgi:hypothetical protein
VWAYQTIHEDILLGGSIHTVEGHDNLWRPTVDTAKATMKTINDLDDRRLRNLGCVTL